MGVFGEMTSNHQDVVDSQVVDGRNVAIHDFDSDFAIDGECDYCKFETQSFCIKFSAE